MNTPDASQNNHVAIMDAMLNGTPAKILMAVNEAGHYVPVALKKGDCVTLLTDDYKDDWSMSDVAKWFTTAKPITSTSVNEFQKTFLKSTDGFDGSDPK